MVLDAFLASFCAFVLLEVNIFHPNAYLASQHKFFYFAFNLVCLALFPCPIQFVFHVSLIATVPF